MQILAVTVTLLSLSGCSSDGGSSENSIMTEQTEDVAALNQLAEDCAAAWGIGAPELLLACYADDAVVTMSNEEPIVGKEALRELYEHVLGNER